MVTPGPRLRLLLSELCISAAFVRLRLSYLGFSGNTEGGRSCLPAAGAEEKPPVSAHFPPSHKSGAFTPEPAEVLTFAYCVGRR